MHHVSRIDESRARTPRVYEGRSTGFCRATYVDHSMGSVHMGVGVCFLDPGGAIQPHLHSFEESFYVLDGSLTVEIGETTHALSTGNFGLVSTGVRHALRNTGAKPARWLEMQAPQPRSLEYGRDTYF